MLKLPNVLTVLLPIAGYSLDKRIHSWEEPPTTIRRSVSGASCLMQNNTWTLTKTITNYLLVLIINIMVILNTCIINNKLILGNSRRNNHKSFTYRCYLLRLPKPTERRTKVSISLKYFCKKTYKQRRFYQWTVISKKYD